MLLIIQYYRFKQETQLMVALQDEYHHYITTFKRVLDKSKLQEFNVISEEGDQKKKDVTTWVNREIDYLKKSALSYGKLYNIEQAMDLLYDAYDWDEKEGYQLGPIAKPVGLGNKRSVLRPSRAINIAHYQTDSIFKWPMKQGSFRIGSRFGPRKKVDGQWGFHHGLDLPAPKGTPVYAAAPGVIWAVSRSPNGYGNEVVIYHSKKYKTRYAHLDTILVTKGQEITQDHCIGRVGATGTVRGKKPYHLHFEVMVFGKKINPLYVLPK